MELRFLILCGRAHNPMTPQTENQDLYKTDRKPSVTNDIRSPAPVAGNNKEIAIY